MQLIVGTSEHHQGLVWFISNFLFSFHIFINNYNINNYGIVILFLFYFLFLKICTQNTVFFPTFNVNKSISSTSSNICVLLLSRKNCNVITKLTMRIMLPNFEKWEVQFRRRSKLKRRIWKHKESWRTKKNLFCQTYTIERYIMCPIGPKKRRIMYIQNIHVIF